MGNKESREFNYNPQCIEITGKKLVQVVGESISRLMNNTSITGKHPKITSLSEATKHNL